MWYCVVQPYPMQTPFSWFITAALLLLLLVQGWFIVRNKTLSKSRKWVRAILNVLLWCVVAAYAMQFTWPVSRPATHALLVGDEVPGAVARRVQDSLGIQDRFNGKNFNPEYDSVTLLGQQFPTETLTQLSNARVQWMPYDEPDRLQDIRWKGMVRQGEMQRVTGRIGSTRKQVLRLRFGSQTLDSLVLQPGENSFALQFPAFTRGRSQAVMQLAGEVLDTLRFYARPRHPIPVQFILNNPDFESKTLANYLGEQGNMVNVSATLSKDISSELRINNAPKLTAKTPPDLFITEPVNAANASIRKAIADGKAVLFINLTNPETDVRTINQATGSRFQVRKMANVATVPVGNGLNALPYRFADYLNQFAVAGYPVAVQRGNGKVGVSLLSETFPLALSGDSLTYARVWQATMTQLMPDETDNIQVGAPVYQRLLQPITLNNPARPQTTLRLGQDTLILTPLPLNPQSATAHSLFPAMGWQPVQDSLAVFVSPLTPTDPVANRAIVRQFMRTHSAYSGVQKQKEKTTTAEVPDWGWLLAFLVCFTALWAEPKF